MILPRCRYRRYTRFPMRYLRNIRSALLIFFVVFFFDTTYTIFTRPLTTPRIRPTTPAAQGNWSVYVVSVHRNTEHVQLAGWNQAVEALARYLGPSRMFFSAVESGSQDRTKIQLKDVKARLDQLGIENEMSLGMTVAEQLKELGERPPKDRREDGWIWNHAQDRWDMRRIPYLSRVRNQAMQPLYELERRGRKFDRVLWLNDVIFDTEDVVTLLNTRRGAYAAACSMDFKNPPFYYDTFALRDDHGDKAASFRWPWFVSATSRSKALASDPIPVKSCWNGMVAFDARPFYSLAIDFPVPSDDYHPGALEYLMKRSIGPVDKESNLRVAMSETENLRKRNTHGTAPGIDRLEFRGIADSLADMHLEGSECCLIHADNPLSDDPDLGVWLNPNVRVGYTTLAYHAMHQGAGFPTAWDAFIGSWYNRWWRWRGAVQLSLEKYTVTSRIHNWIKEGEKLGERRVEKGVYCLINEMQIMYSNGWKHL